MFLRDGCVLMFWRVAGNCFHERTTYLESRAVGVFLLTPIAVEFASQVLGLQERQRSRRFHIVEKPWQLCYRAPLRRCDALDGLGRRTGVSSINKAAARMLELILEQPASLVQVESGASRETIYRYEGTAASRTCVVKRRSRSSTSSG